MNVLQNYAKAPKSKRATCVQLFIPCKLHSELSIFEGKSENNTIDVNGYKLPLSDAAQFNLRMVNKLEGRRSS